MERWVSAGTGNELPERRLRHNIRWVSLVSRSVQVAAPQMAHLTARIRKLPQARSGGFGLCCGRGASARCLDIEEEAPYVSCERLRVDIVFEARKGFVNCERACTPCAHRRHAQAREVVPMRQIRVDLSRLTEFALGMDFGSASEADSRGRSYLTG
jgi:hypothetical protein